MEQQGTGVLNKGTRLGEYEIERLLGVGAMGSVYEAVCTPTGHRHAIKVLSPALAAVPTARARFKKEAELTSRVRHPHIVQVSDVGEDAGRCYFVMELLSGEDLGKRLHRRGTLAAAEIVDILLPVCDAVAEAHRRGVTHRDLKPSNIFLLVRGKRPHPVVLDFGIAEEGPEDTRRTRVGFAVDAAPARRAVFGTPYYLAPEQVADHQTAGPASDQYALGVILYECLTGHPPYRGDKVEEVFRAIAAGNPPPPSTRRPDIRQEMDAVVLRALSVDPKARFASVVDLRRALEPFSSSATGVTSGSYKRTPSSPAIEVEARTPTPFVRTLTPEVEALDAAWFAAGEAQESAAQTASPTAMTAGLEDPEGESSGATVPPVVVESESSRRLLARFASRRIWIGAAAGVAVVSLVLALVAKSGNSSTPRQALSTPPEAALVQVEPAAAAKPPADNSTLPTLPTPPAAATPAPAAAAAAPSGAPAPSEAPPAAPAVVKEAPPAPEPAVVAKEAPAVKEAAPASEPALAVKHAPAAKEAPPAPEHARVRRERSSVEDETSRARKSSSKPRTTRADSSGVRMHNGVPLLD